MQVGYTFSYFLWVSCTLEIEEWTGQQKFTAHY
jgi:hypothetical protein